MSDQLLRLMLHIVGWQTHCSNPKNVHVAHGIMVPQTPVAPVV